ncbi:flavin monoamine oxidase family protein [Streptomyces syringium]|uniref:flavin monoamine oxidase family protein n=1 Tax=Streptomyces syringium TaxID=76729 RepID=UPI0033B0DA74
MCSTSPIWHAHEPSEAEGRKGRRVTVIGAGVAGLVAAYELERLNYRVRILEGNTRIGGRVHTHRFGPAPGAPSVELGAMRIPAHHHRTLNYLEHLHLGENVREFRTLLSDENAFLHTAEGFVRIRDASGPLHRGFRRELARERHPGSYDDATVAFGAWLTAVVGAIAPPDLRDALRADLRRQLLDLVARLDPPPYPAGAAGGRVDLHALFATYPGIRAGCSGRLNSFLDDILTETSPALLRIEGGMDQLPRRLAERLRGPVACGRKVVGIDVRKHDVLVRSRAGAGTVVEPSDFVVCTVPFPALRRMRLTGLDADKLAVLREVDYCPATKVAFHCREPFWQADGIAGGASFTGGSIRQTYYPPVDGGPGRGAALLASYTIGREAGRLGRMSPRRRHRLVLEELSAVHPELLRPGMVLDAVSTAWGHTPWTVGCAMRWGKDAAEVERERTRAARPVRRLFFAGEHTSTTPAWIEGAVESALRAVEEIDGYAPSRHPAATLGIHDPAGAC